MWVVAAEGASPSACRLAYGGARSSPSSASDECGLALRATLPSSKPQATQMGSSICCAVLSTVTCGVAGMAMRGAHVAGDIHARLNEPGRSHRARWA